MADHTPTRSDEIKAIHREYKFFYQVLGGSLLVAIGILIGAIAFSSELDRSAYFINLYTSLLSILVTVFVIDFLNRRRDERRELRQLQQQLIRDAGSTSNEIAKNAVHQLSKRGWLVGSGGLLGGANLLYANLEGAHLRYANLNGADLSGAKLQGAILVNANLNGARLNGANLKGADLHFANLQEAFLSYAKLQGADLHDAKLQGAHLRYANLNGADLSGAKLQWVRLDETTILPDGSHWTPKTDLTKFGCIIE